MATTRTRDRTAAAPPPEVGEKERIAQAVSTLFDNYSKDPFITSFFRHHGVPPRGTKEELRRDVRASLTGPKGPLPLTFETFVETLDALQTTGAQHVAFFQLPEKGNAAMLGKLADPDFLHKRLDHAGWVDCFDRRRFVWLPAKPTLVHVHFEPGRLLLFEWVEPRLWYRFEKETVGANGERLRVWEPRWERSVDFVRFDLKRGDSEVMIQRLHHNPDKKVTAEIDSYRHLMVSLLGFDPFERVSLEPAIRRMLSGGVREVNRWEIELGGSSRMEAAAGRSSFRTVEIQADFRGRLLRWNWRPEQGSRRRIRLQLDARNDTLEIVHPCLAEEHERILAGIRQSASGPLPHPVLRTVKHRDLKVALG